MKDIINTSILLVLFGIFSCESSEDISREYDHEVPKCKALTLSVNGQTVAIPDTLVTQLLWGVVPQTNLETISLPTLTAQAGLTIDISMEISDNAALKTADLNYSSWLFSEYINFSNPVDDIPENPQAYQFHSRITVPEDAITTPWIETFYFNDGSSIKYVQSYHKLELTLEDVNMNSCTIPIFIKIE